MTGTPRDLARQRTIAEIIRIGRAHLAEQGAAALSLRAVARELGVVSSAVYRYVASRDELLTLLIIDGYTELGDEVDAALATADNPQDRFRALAHAVRDWAIREPARYALLYGSPVPGYAAPPEQTVGPGTRVIRALIGIYEDAFRRGALQVDEPVSIPDGLRADFEAVRGEFGVGAPDILIARGVLVWAALFGVITFEVFRQYGEGTFTDSAALFDLHIETLLATLGFS